MNETSRVRSSKNVFAREFDGELVLLDLARGDYYGLDAVGARLWQSLMEGASVDETAATLAQDYDVDPSVLRADLMALLSELADKGLVELRDE